MTTDRNKRSTTQPDHTQHPAERAGSAMNPLPTPTHGDVNQVSPATRAMEASPEPYEGQFEEFRTQEQVDRQGKKVAGHPGLEDEDERRRAGRDEKDLEVNPPQRGTQGEYAPKGGSKAIDE